MKRLAVLSSLLIIGCLSDPDRDGSPAAAIDPGTYRAALSMKWYEDDVAPRNFVDEHILYPDNTGEASLYLVRNGDTTLLCENEGSWKQSGSSMLTWNTRQRCKDPDYLAGGFDPWDEFADTTSSTVRNVTAAGFEMQGSDVDGRSFWVAYRRVP